MKKKVLAIILALIMMTAIIPPETTHATGTVYYLTSSLWAYHTFDFESKGIQQGDVICISSDAQYVKLVGSTSVTYYDVIILTESSGGCYFILENLNITGMYGDNTTPLVINGTGNTVEIRGTCNLLAPVDVGIQVESGDELTLTGSGTLNVRGGYNIPTAPAAGIGGRYQQNCGTVNIKGSVNLSVESGSYASAIGGGGGGINASTWPVTTIKGGSGGTVSISENAVVYTNGGSSDIGAGYSNSSKGSLTISGNAAVFFAHNSVSSFGTLSYSSNHNYIAGSYTFGYSVSGSVAASLTIKKLCTITYDANGGTGSASSKYEQDTTVTLNSGSSFSRDGYTLTGWADSSDGIKDYDLSDTFTLGTSDVTLYAAWSPYDIEYDLDGGTNNASNPATYESSSTPITLYSPVKDGSQFLGWYDSSDFSSSSLVSEISSGTEGNLSYYARWNTIPTLDSGASESTTASVLVNTQYSLDLGSIFTDADGDTLSYQVSVGGEAYASVSESFSCKPISVGTVVLVFKANDGFCDSNKTYQVTLYSTAPTATPTPEATPTPAVTATFTATATPVATTSATATATATPAATSTATASATASPTATATSTATSSGSAATATATSYSISQTATPSPSDAPSATAASSSVIYVTATPSETEPNPTQTAAVVSITAEVTTEDGKASITIDVADLPEGTTSITLPSGETVSVADAQDGKLLIEVDESEAVNGYIEVIAVNDEQTALGYYSVELPAENGRTIPFGAWLLGGLLAAFWAVFGLRQIFKARTNPRNVRRQNH